MAIDARLAQREYDKFIESTDTAGQVAIKVTNPDGSEVGGGGAGVAAYSDSGDTTRQGLVDAQRHVQTDVLSIAAGSNNIGDVDIASALPAGSNNIGDVDIASSVALDVSAATVTVDATGQGDVPVTLDSEEVVLGTGSNAIGKLAANSGVDIGDVDVTSLPALASGTNNVGYVSMFRRSDAVQATITSANATSATQVVAKVAAKNIYVTDIIISTDTAMNIQLQDDAGTPVVLMEQIYVPASSVFSKSFTTPLQVATNQDLDVIASAAGNISVTVTGYQV